MARGDAARSDPGRYQIEASRYDSLHEHLFGRGFSVVRADPSAGFFDTDHVAMREDGRAVLDWALEERARENPGDSIRVGVLGHGLGGKIAFMIASADSRVEAVLGIDPVNGGGGFGGYSAARPDIVPDPVQTISIPVGLFGELTDSEGVGLAPACAPSDQNFRERRRELSVGAFRGRATAPG